MTNIVARIISKINSFYSAYKALMHKDPQIHRCRILHIEKNEISDYIAVVQMVGKDTTFTMKPEEILADDELTDCFSQRDIRTLTYLGYLGINCPKYTILAKRLSELDSRLIFAIREKGKKKPIIKTADEIGADKALLGEFNQVDAHMLGYAAAIEQTQSENKQKNLLLKTLKEEKKNHSLEETTVKE